MRSTPISVLTPVCLALAACGASQPARPSAARPSPVLTAPTVASTPAARALPRIQLARLRTTRQSFCDAAATTTTAGDNFCQLQLVLPFDDGRILVAGAFRGSVRIGTRTLRSRGMQNALAVMYAPDGSIAWLRTNGAQWHNNIVHAVPLADGRIAVAGIAANGFHPSLSVRPTQRNLEFNAERPFVGVLTAQGEWAWLRDWNTPVGDLRAAPDGGFAVLDAARVSRVDASGHTVTDRALPTLPARAIVVEQSARLGANDCAWVLFLRNVDSVFPLTARATCGDVTNDWPLADVPSLQPTLRVAMSPDGAALYVDALTGRLDRGGQGPSTGAVQQTLWRLDAATGVRFAVQAWPVEDYARLPDDRSDPMALLAGDDSVDLLVSHRLAAVVAGVALADATVPSLNGVPRSAVIVRFAGSDGSPVGLFAPTSSEDAALVHTMTASLLAARSVIARAAGAADRARWIHGGTTPCEGCREERVVVSVVEARR